MCPPFAQSLPLKPIKLNINYVPQEDHLSSWNQTLHLVPLETTEKRFLPLCLLFSSNCFNIVVWGAYVCGMT